MLSSLFPAAPAAAKNRSIEQSGPHGLFLGGVQVIFAKIAYVNRGVALWHLFGVRIEVVNKRSYEASAREHPLHRCDSSFRSHLFKGTADMRDISLLW